MPELLIWKHRKRGTPDLPGQAVGQASHESGVALYALASLARSLLESDGIPTYLSSEHTLGKAATNEGLSLMVPLQDAERARELLETRVSDAEFGAAVEATCDPDTMA